MNENIRCLFGITLDDAVMSYDAFVYLLLRIATDDDCDSFRRAFDADYEAILKAAGHEINLEVLGDERIEMPSKEDAQKLLRTYLIDYDGARNQPRINPYRIAVTDQDLAQD